MFCTPSSDAASKVSITTHWLKPLLPTWPRTSPHWTSWPSATRTDPCRMWP